MAQLLLNLIPKNEWPSPFQFPLMVAGPCAAETPEQVLETARGLKAIEAGIQVFRAGVWKPRTRPNQFEGLGEHALPWLQQVKKETGMLIAVEVANAQHVELALEKGVDVLWIGARTTVNPFSVQEIADAVKGNDIPVFVKNPLHPDLQLWLGALERINRAGITKLAAVHRGFHAYEKSGFRNHPRWEIPIELKRLCPELPVLCDPSHIAGSRQLVLEVAQKAMDLAMDGLMIESHWNPAAAWSDAQQQLLPADLNQLLQQLVHRTPMPDQLVKNETLESLRSELDRIDAQMLELLAARMRVVQDLGEFKAANNLTVLQLDRWQHVFKQGKLMGKQLGLSEDFVQQFIQLLHQESVRMQTDILQDTIKPKES